MFFHQVFEVTEDKTNVETSVMVVRLSEQKHGIRLNNELLSQ